jgi:hypothetical protein
MSTSSLPLADGRRKTEDGRRKSVPSPPSGQGIRGAMAESVPSPRRGEGTRRGAAGRGLPNLPLSGRKRFERHD